METAPRTETVEKVTEEKKKTSEYDATDPGFSRLLCRPASGLAEQWILCSETLRMGNAGQL